jgi:hypothetical protein
MEQSERLIWKDSKRKAKVRKLEAFVCPRYIDGSRSGDHLVAPMTGLRGNWKLHRMPIHWEVRIPNYVERERAIVDWGLELLNCGMRWSFQSPSPSEMDPVKKKKKNLHVWIIASDGAARLSAYYAA